ncbi:hypothetical protein WN944_001969 [Citrus x changshan-huyou]|uniref:Uncharacterized protein n=1 Tax=Citrus x changshan-huyou TaxID=2935761 RepID=A0AAP0MFM8_9ROSI
MVTVNSFIRNVAQYLPLSPDTDVTLVDRASVVTKGKVVDSGKILDFVRLIDISRNNFSGNIPLESMSSLTFLSHLNLSNNNLIGKIPSSTQLQSFDASSFVGNDLCGAPLPRNCTDRNVSIPKDEIGVEDEDEVEYWLYVSVALGFVVGFWCFIGPLLVNRRWRYKYCSPWDIIFGVLSKCC